MHNKNYLVLSYKVIYEQFVPPPSQVSSLGRNFSFSFVYEQNSSPLYFLFLSFFLFLFLPLSYFLGGDCGGRWRNKDTGLGYALSDEQRRNAFIHRRRWWWMRGAHQREPIRSCSRTTNEERRGVEGTEGWESGINVARASSAKSFALWPRNSWSSFASLQFYLAVPKRETYPATSHHVRYHDFEHHPSWRDPCFVKKRKKRYQTTEQTRDQCYCGYRSEGQKSERFLFQQWRSRLYNDA